jgi:hypothetical protein
VQKSNNQRQRNERCTAFKAAPQNNLRSGIIGGVLELRTFRLGRTIIKKRSILCPASLETLSEARQLITDVRNFQPSKEELEKHSEFLKKINSPIWESFS